MCIVHSYIWYVQVSRAWEAKWYIVPILTMAIIYNTPKFFELHVETKASEDRNTTAEENTEEGMEVFEHLRNTSGLETGNITDLVMVRL